MIQGQPAGRVFYAAGPGDIIGAYRSWQHGEEYAKETSVTFSSQVVKFCQNAGLSAMLVGYGTTAARFTDGDMILECRPKWASGLLAGAAWHRREIAYGAGLWWSALRFGANTVIVDSGTTMPFVLWLFKLTGMRVFLVQHNAHRPVAVKQEKSIQWLRNYIDGSFYRWGADAILTVSPALARILHEDFGQLRARVYQVRAQFSPENFLPSPPPAHSLRPFRIVAPMRMEVEKGALDVVEIAERLQRLHPGQFHIDLAGEGTALAEVRRRLAAQSLEPTLTVHGWVEPGRLCEMYRACHVVLVSTRSAFVEGLPMTAAEAVLSVRPFVASRAVPALELMPEAAFETAVDDVESTVQTLCSIAQDASAYEAKVEACWQQREAFFDSQRGLAAALQRAYEQVADLPEFHSERPPPQGS